MIKGRILNIPHVLIRVDSDFALNIYVIRGRILNIIHVLIFDRFFEKSQKVILLLILL